MEIRKTVDGKLYWAVIARVLKDAQFLLTNPQYRTPPPSAEDDRPSRLEAFMALRWLLDDSPKYKIDRDFICERAGIDGDWLRDRCRDAVDRKNSLRRQILFATMFLRDSHTS